MPPSPSAYTTPAPEAKNWPWVRRAALAGASLALLAGALTLGALWVNASSVGPLGADPSIAPPLGVAQGARPMVLLTMARDHTLFYEAYNDASDINGDGVIDTRFNPNIIYTGLFDSRVCYEHDDGDDDGGFDDDDALFEPERLAVVDPGTNRHLSCSDDDEWSGNWLNWATTSRIDALRVVLYGGYREVDTANRTILRRAYIPQDAHSWAKEYTSTAVDGYAIEHFTPFRQPNANRRHFFGNLTPTAGVNCSNINDCSRLPPLLRVIENSSRRVWQWASSERPVLRTDATHAQWGHHGERRTDLTVRVEVCTANFNAGCRRYPNNRFKPVGLLHDFGENDSMHFGLLTGSYNRNLSGGVLRKVVSSFRNEVNSNDGTFTAQATIVNTINALRIRDFNNTRTDNAYRSGWVTTRPMNEGEFVDWGNPIAEMMYEGLRYFAGRRSPTSDFDTSGGHDEHLGLPRATWDDPFAASAAGRWCARPSQVVISDVNPSFDSDQLPGSAFASFTGDLTGLNVSAIGQTIATNEPGLRGMRFIGQVGTQFDAAPTAKDVQSLGNIRGLSPEAPTQQGSFYSASVAHFGRVNDLRADHQQTQSVDTFVVALSSPLPQIVVPISGGRNFTLVPFAKSVGGFDISNVKGQFQPTNQIVDFYVESIANSCPQAAGGVASMCADHNAAINGGRYQAVFRINFEDVEVGADHDMDAIVRYEISLQADGSLRVVVTPQFEAGGIQHAMGYVLSGSTADGVYLVVQDQNVDRPYFLNVPPGQAPGFCDATPFPAGCGTLPRLGGGTGNDHSDRSFTAAASGTAASVLPSPLWLAAKWGGFTDLNNNQRPDLAAEWDSNGDGVPDTFHPVQNPTQLRASLARAFETVLARNAAAGNITANSTSITTETKVFQATFNSANWSGDLAALPVAASGGSGWSASAQLQQQLQQPAGLTNRRLFTTNGAASPSTIRFTWTDLRAANQHTQLGTNDTERQQIIDYLRGDSSREQRNGGTLRNRPTGVLGDIVHSSPVYVRDNDTVFVGSNSGFLHAFNASNGSERFAFAPNQLLAQMDDLARPTAQRRFRVDGELAVSSRAHTGGRNILVGFLGRGGRGLFALDVTDPANFGASGNASRALWEATGSADNDMGFLVGRPVIARVRSGSGTVNAVIFGNGYNSPNGRAALYVKNLSTGALISRIPVGPSGNNGLASPGLALDGNGVVQFAYAGDLLGNVWKFDLSHSNPNQWGSFHSSGSTPVPFFVTRSGQPITAPITVANNTVEGDPNFGRRFIFFGTGRYLASPDPANRDVQSFYGLIDRGLAIANHNNLVQRSINQVGTAPGPGGSTRAVRTITPAAANDMSGRDGWFLDWREPSPATPRGERVVSAARLLGTEPATLVVSSIIPDDSDPCAPGGAGFVNLFDPFSGGALMQGVIDLNENANFEDDRLAVGPGTQFITSFDPQVGMPGESVLVGDRLVVGGTAAEVDRVAVRLPRFGPRGRISWREIVR